ncbi:cytochrome P450 [Streptomyces mesophilus]|uniref:cytochrome P450 n=1 Tax=Streptomyces mesophilus TaxID=1775132 RepID=UPI003317AE86
MTRLAVDPALLTDPQAHASGDVHEVWRWMRQHAPVHHHKAGDYPAFWSVTRYEDIRRVYTDPAAFISAHGVMLRPLALGDDPAGGVTIALCDPPRHGAARALVADLFAGRAVRGLEQHLRGTARGLIRTAQESGSCEFVHDVAAPLTAAVIGSLLGVGGEDRDNLLEWTSEAFEQARPLATHPQLMAFLAELMDECVHDPGEDLLSRLVTGTVAGQRLTPMEALLNCENVIGAAENSSLSLAGGILAFAGRPHEWDLLTRHREYLPHAVNEVLRWTSSATHSMRTATTTVSLAGRTVAAGERVVLWLPSANRDESAFERPDEFRVTRRPNRHMSFGAGPHACIGAALARLQSTALLSELLDSGRWFEPAGPHEPLRSIVVGGPARLPARVAPFAAHDRTRRRTARP